MENLNEKERSKSAPPVLPSLVKRTKQKLWTNKKIEEAMYVVGYSKAGINEAARMYTLCHQLLCRIGRIKHGTWPHPKRY